MVPISNAMGRRTIALTCCAYLLAWVAHLGAEEAVSETAAGVDRCRECHDYAPADHVEGLLQGSHGISPEAGFERGCEDCHGPSAAHAAAPREVAPAISFGPRWPTEGADQDLPCLACHEAETHRDWQHSLHMLNSLTCVTCHDIHAEVDNVLFEEHQAQVCTMCHEQMKKGIHGLGGLPQGDPPCAHCHNPHDHETAGPQMQANQSAGCRHCHDLDAMAEDPLVSKLARDYHRTMQVPDRTCVDCHKNIAHSKNKGFKRSSSTQ